MSLLEFLLGLFMIEFVCFIVMSIVHYIGYYAFFHLPDCKEYPNMYTKDWL